MSVANNTGQAENPLSEVIKSSTTGFASAGIFSCAVNILMLTGPLFMLQVYDRVLTSRSVPTLIALFALVVALYGFLGLFDFLRSRVLSRIGYRVDVRLMETTNQAWIRQSIVSPQIPGRPLSDLTTLRQFFTSNALPALFDLPWLPIYLIVVYLLHPWLGYLALLGALLVVAFTILASVATRKPTFSATAAEIRDANFSESIFRNSDVVVAMGMGGALTRRWMEYRGRGLTDSQIAGDRSELITAITKITRMIVQSAMLALGAYLAIFQEITPGTMIAASILGGRALAPVDQITGNWRGIIRARAAYQRLGKYLDKWTGAPKQIKLPDPVGNLNVHIVAKYPPHTPNLASQEIPILQRIDFDLSPGDALGVVGPSASGKSTLAKLLVGLWMPDEGSIRFDDASFEQWDLKGTPEKLGPHIGYLPQNAQLLDGTIAQNISRFLPDINDGDIVEAAKLAGVHELILALPDGYATEVFSGNSVLSGGQIQRIAFARAIFGNPKLIVLDEPNSNLDAEGDIALTKAIVSLREQGATLIIMAHRPSAIAAVNLVLMLKNGRQLEFGPKDEVLGKFTRPSEHLKLKAELKPKIKKSLADG
ncbi:MAG: type I secretion system permease/ATPase [Hyphomicrobiales bacterium]|nr:type I secretion system permease/ATPase [Hyphomicrobiales bacterium]